MRNPSWGPRNPQTLRVKSLTVTGSLLASDGSAAAPSYSFSSTGSSDNGMFLAATNALGFSTAGVEAMRIDTSQNVGIGEAAPAGYALHVARTTGSAQVSIEAGTNFNSAIYFGDQAAAMSGALIYAHNGDYLALHTNGAERVRITSAGVLDLAAGQIKFPATQAASADANTLDDYEEGTWTPSDGSGAGLSFSGVTARYTKVGRAYVLQASLTYPGTASGANATIASVPFTEADYSTGALNSGGTGGGTVAVANGITIALVAPGGAVLTNTNMSGATARFSIPCMV